MGNIKQLLSNQLFHDVGITFKKNLEKRAKASIKRLQEHNSNLPYILKGNGVENK